MNPEYNYYLTACPCCGRSNLPGETGTDIYGRSVAPGRFEGVGLSKYQITGILGKENTSTAGTQGEKGSRLGLFLVLELLEKINATLIIESEPGKGSRFMIVLAAV